MTRRVSFASDAQRMARAAQSDMANLQRAMRAAQGTLNGLNRAIYAPNTTPRPRMIRGSRTTAPLAYSLIGMGLGSVLSDALGGSYDPSAGQYAATLAKGVLQGQRIL